MESIAQLESMIGTQGSEIRIYCSIDNTYYSPNQFAELLEGLRNNGHPRIEKQYYNSSKHVRVTWTWIKQTSRFNPYGFCLVHSNETQEDI